MNEDVRFEYLPDLPKIPDELYSDIYRAVSQGRAIEHHFYQYIQLYEYPKSVLDFLKDSDPFFRDPDWEFRIQMILNGLPVHIDHGRRKWSYNYLIDTGGSTALTVFYEGTGWAVEHPKYNIIDSYNIEQGIWHKLDTSLHHNVINFWKPRLALSMAKYDKSDSKPWKITD